MEGNDWSGVSMGDDCVDDHCEVYASYIDSRPERAGDGKGARLVVALLNSSSKSNTELFGTRVGYRLCWTLA